MKITITIPIFILLLSAMNSSDFADQKSQGPIPVKIEKIEKGGSAEYRLLRDNKPYQIKGVGGKDHLDLLVKVGGNSIRTWGVNDLEPILDQAQKKGLTVCVGIWLGHERHGFNYNNADMVADQYQKACAAIRKYKDHPAVLLWGIGNEMEGNEKGDNAAIWSAINKIALAAKQIDPSHPTMTVIAEIGGDRVKNIHRLCPAIDIIGINSYGGVASIPQRYKKLGGSKPYIITEFGPPGIWESRKNDWGAYPELSSSKKAEYYRKGYIGAVQQSQGMCLGSYAFVWGHKQEATATWFGMLLPDGSRLAAVDALQKLWTEKTPVNLCPVIDSLTCKGEVKVKPETVLEIQLSCHDPENDPLQINWVLQADPNEHGSGGDNEPIPPIFPEAILQNINNSDHPQVKVRMPKGGGGYRLFVFVHDNHGGAAVANLPLYVDAPKITPKAKSVTFPFVIYDEADRKSPPYIPSGWMGNSQALKIDSASKVNPHSGQTCLQVTYSAPDQWAGVVWQSPANNWGNLPGGYDLSKAKKLSFFARGESGNEVVQFSFGIIGKDKKYPDSSSGKLDKLKLSKDWQKYTIDLSGKDLTRIQTGFVFSLAGQNQQKTVFYLDDIRYED